MTKLSKVSITLIFTIIVTILSASAPISGSACTSFFLGRGNAHFVARSFDGPGSIKMIIVNRRGVEKSAMSLYADTRNTARWVSTFGSVTFNQVGSDLAIFGVNEVGLTVQRLFLPNAEYPISDLRPVISQQQWPHYLLDNCATVADVKIACKQVRIYSASPLYGQHYFVSDNAGRCIVIDSLEGRTILHTGKRIPVRALVDSRNYEQCLHFLKRHPQIGTRAVSGDDIDLERFVRVALELKKSELTIGAAFQLLESVRIEKRTQWQIVYDAGSKNIFFRTKKNCRLRVISIADFDYSCKKPLLMSNLDAEETVPFLLQFLPYSIAYETKSMNEISPIYPFSQSILEMIAGYPESFICRLP